MGHALIALIAIALSGCSTWRLAYNQSENLAYWWVDRHLDLSSEQKPLVREALADWHRWHRQQQLPQYLEFVQRAQGMALRNVSADEVCAWSRDVQGSLVQLARQIEPAATQLLVQLQAPQLRQLRERYDVGNADWREEWLDGSAEQRLRHRHKQALGRLEDAYGRLDTAQRELLLQWLSQSGYDPAMAYAERLRRQADSIQTMERLRQPNTHAQTHAGGLARGWIDRAFESPEPRHREYAQALWLNNCQGFARLHNSTSPEQRQRLLQTLRTYEQDIRGLMRG